MELNYKVFGNGHPVVILHGLFGMLDNWQWIAKQLADQYMVYILDLRNHGRSPHLPDHSYALMAEDLRAFMEQHWLYEAHVIGHSMGGKVAMQMALEYPDIVSKLIVADIAPKYYEDHHSTIFQALFAVNAPALESRQQAEMILKQHIEEADVQQFLLKNLYLNPDTGKYAWKMNLDVLYATYPKILHHELPSTIYEGDTLFIRGERSRYILPEEWHLCTQYFPAAKLETIEHAGHWVHAEQPHRFLNIVQSFLV